jgi:hypothetical protein
VYRTWQAYFQSKGGDLADGAGTPSPLWVANEQAQWPMYDLAGFYVPAGAIPHVVNIRRVQGRDPVAYEIVVRFTEPRLVRATDSARTRITATWIVEQRAGRWLLANVLPQRTRNWHTERVGQIRYFVAPLLTFNRTRAIAAAKFVDSLTAAFDLPRLDALDYYVVPTVDAALDALGVDSPTRYGPSGGFSKPVNHQLFAGIPMWGENYRHELTHVVLLPLYRSGPLTIVGTEGVATWLGGTSGMTWKESVRSLRTFLRSHPTATLDSAITQGSIPQTDTYAAGAVLCDIVFRRGGTPAVRAFLTAGPGPNQVRAELLRLFGASWERIAREWRAAVDTIAAEGGPA